MDIVIGFHTDNNDDLIASPHAVEREWTGVHQMHSSHASSWPFVRRRCQLAPMRIMPVQQSALYPGITGILLIFIHCPSLRFRCNDNKFLIAKYRDQLFTSTTLHIIIII
jgi:hypothetical protein